MDNSFALDLSDFAEIGEFKPVAYYDPHMDFIRVCTHDASVTELRFDEFLTLHQCNSRSDTCPEFVGFTLKGIKHLFDELRVPLEGVIPLTALIDQIVKHQPGTQMTLMLQMCRNNLAESQDLTVDLQELSA